MSKSVVSAFGTFDEKQLKLLKDSLSNLCDIYTMMDAQKDAAKEVIDNVFEELKIPKSLVRKMAKTYYKANFYSVVSENEEFETLYNEAVNEIDVSIKT